MRLKVLVLVMVVLLGYSQACTDAAYCFVSHLFNFNLPKEGLYNVSITYQPSLFRVKAYADFNRDLQTDFIAINNQNQIIIYLWDKPSSVFIPLSPIPINPICSPTQFYLYDINKDGLLDFTIWGTNSNNNCVLPYTQNVSDVISFIQQTNALYTTKTATTNPIIMSHTNPEGVIGLLLFDQSRIILQYNIPNNSYQIIPWTNYFQSNSTYQITPFRSRHWNTYIDFTGDCLADLIIFNQLNQIEFWINKGINLVLANAFNLSNSSNLTAFGVSDTNYDGGVDLVIVNGDIFSIYYNRVVPRSQDDFCCSYCNTYPYSAQSMSTFNLGVVLPQQNIRFGDVNIDGFADILISKPEGNSLLPAVYINDGNWETTFLPSNTYNDVLREVLNGVDVLDAAWFDVLENGIVDVFVIGQNDNGYSHYTILNNYLYQNSFFIKGYGSVGPPTGSPMNTCVYPGIVFYWVNSVSGVLRMGTNSQYTQTAYDSLQMPYILSGLGRANNYVESFMMSKEGQSRVWAPIIPNSQLAVLARGTSNNWDIKIFVLPTESLIYVIIVTTIILILMGVSLIIVKYKKFKKGHNVQWI